LEERRRSAALEKADGPRRVDPGRAALTLFQPEAAIDEPLVGVEVGAAQFGGVDGVAALQRLDELFLDVKGEQNEIQLSGHVGSKGRRIMRRAAKTQCLDLLGQKTRARAEPRCAGSAAPDRPARPGR